MFDTETWKFINTFAPWVSAIGTIAAVITSLYLAIRDYKIRLKVDNFEATVSFHHNNEHPNFQVLHITNVGSRYKF
jgi:hypothetical protein